MVRNEMRWRLREPQTPNWAPGYEIFPICEMKGTNQSLFPSSLTFECSKVKEPLPSTFRSILQSLALFRQVKL